MSKRLEMNGTTASQRKMAVKIAEDVLLTMRYLTICRMTYLDVDSTCKLKEYEPVEKGTEPKMFKGCSVCARGAMFISRARLFNSVDLDEFNVCCTTAKDFGTTNAVLIESAFECAATYAESVGVTGDKAAAFGKKYADPRNRLRAIMKNVIANKGVFRP